MRSSLFYFVAICCVVAFKQTMKTPERQGYLAGLDRNAIASFVGPLDPLISPSKFIMHTPERQENTFASTDNSKTASVDP